MTEQERLAQLRPHLTRRAELFWLTRRFFREQGFVEIETPVRTPALAPEANIAPMESEGWYLITSPELHMKRLLAAGYERIFQLSRCFRRAERGRFHHPEFTLLEWYRAGANYLDIIQDTEQLLLFLAENTLHTAVLNYQGRQIDLTPPWDHLSVQQAYLKFAGWDPIVAFDGCRFDDDMALRVIPSLAPERPIVLMDYPREAASLARLKPEDPNVAERAEIFLGGLELANAYSELNNRKEQMWRFSEEAALIEKTQGRRMPLPQSFLEAVGHLPPAGGIALGLDRLAMLFCGASSIDEVLAFTAETA
ncbi:MAG: EF-P lysine aminoacylase EpmA [Dehalococcoidia bacterium]|nr:EF-P lysine aminoacylase EpmA [Dehalococcoidia bacterium]